MNTIRNDLICAALTGLCANPEFAHTKIEDLADLAIKHGDATLAKLNAESPITGSAEVDWSQAPEWAMWHAFDGMNAGGQGWFYQDKPHFDKKDDDWNNPGRLAGVSWLAKPANLAARDSLTRRPGK
jgi:hypothetical protein